MDLELHDWEVLDDSNSNSDQNTSYLEGIERDSEGIIRSDYFSLDSHTKYASIEDVTDQLSVESDNPSWIDPVSDTRYLKSKPIGELWSTDGSDDGRFIESESNNNDNEVEIEAKESLSDSGDVESKAREDEIGEGLGEEKIVEEIKSMKVDGEERNKVAVWWKLPLDLLKYCLFKASPVWSLSVAAAMMGVVILGRRLYKMKQKTRTLQLKVIVDDKKVSQVMSRAAKLNEAFSVVKRAPMIRPSLPATGVAPWPMMAIR